MRHTHTHTGRKTERGENVMFLGIDSSMTITKIHTHFDDVNTQLLPEPAKIRVGAIKIFH